MKYAVRRLAWPLLQRTRHTNTGVWLKKKSCSLFDVAWFEMCSFFHHQEIPCQEEDLTHIWKIQHCDLKRGPPNSGVPRRQHVQTCMVDATQLKPNIRLRKMTAPRKCPLKRDQFWGDVSFSGGVFYIGRIGSFLHVSVQCVLLNLCLSLSLPAMFKGQGRE